MRGAALGLIGACMGAFALAAPADELALPANGEATATPDALPQAARGQMLRVACPNVDRIAKSSVEVVMMFAEGDAKTGYRGFLVVEQKIVPGAVQFKVPDMPDLANKIVGVRVHYIDDEGRHSCDGGKVRVL